VAVSRLTALILQHRRRLGRVVEGRGLGPVRTLYEQARHDLLDRLAGLKARGADQTFTAQHARIALIQIEDAIAGFGSDLNDLLDDAGRDAVRLGIDSLSSEIHALEPDFQLAGVPLAIEQAAVFERLTGNARSILRSKFEEGSRRYGEPTLGKIERAMSLSLVRGDTIGQAVDAVAASDGAFARNRYRAERIVRTEMAGAYEFTKLEGMRETAREDLPGMKRQIIATFDTRTGKDSKLIHGEVRGLDEAFWDPIQHKFYMHPPNRPNDREYVIPFHPDWGRAAAQRMAAATKRRG
jgi:hypothetical protein